jgi:hypothetical protein
MRAHSLVCLGAFALSLVACQTLPDIEPGRCGNEVEEAGEDCDTHVPAGQACGSANSTAACKFIWDEGSDCPLGFGWGLDGVCRKPTRTWDRSVSITVPGGGVRALVGDLDGDLLDDLVVGGSSIGRYRVSFLAPGGALRAQSEIPLSSVLSSAAEPAIGSISGRALTPGVPSVRRERLGLDTSADLLVPSSGGLSVLRGREGASLVPKAYASYPVPRSRPMALPAHVVPYDTTGLDIDGVVFETGNATEGYALEIHRRDFGATESVALARLEGVRLEDLVAPIRRIDWSLEHTGPELLLALESLDADGQPQPRLVVLSMGTTGLETETLLDLPLSSLRGASYYGQVFAVDVEPRAPVPDDEAQEIVLAVRRGGDFGRISLVALTRNPSSPSGMSVAIDILMPSAGSAGYLNPPLHIGDFDGDRRIELVDASTVRVFDCPVGQSGSSCALPVAYANDSILPWTDALIDDLNSDGRPDLVASSPLPGIDVVFGLSSGLRLPTSFPVSSLHTGDFDADGSRDVLASMLIGGVDCAVEDQLAIAFGRAGAFPEAPVTVGTLPGIGEVAVGQLFRPERLDAASDFGVVSDCATTGSSVLPAGAAIFLGTPTRQITSPASVAAPDSVGIDVTLGSAIGRFSAASTQLGRDDASAFGIRFGVGNTIRPWLWFAPSHGDAELDLGAARRLDVEFPFDPEQLLLTISAGRSVAVDVDARADEASVEGISDEVLLWLPTGELSSDRNEDGLIVGMVPRLVVVEVDSNGSPKVRSIVSGETSSFDEAKVPFAVSSEVLSADLDGDGDLDALGFLRLSDTSSLHVFWNDGAGSFTEQRISLDVDLALPNGQTTRITGVALLEATFEGPASRVVVSTDDGIHLLSLSGQPSIEATLVEGSGRVYSGVVTGDFDGDGRVDIAALRLEGTDIFRQVEADSESISGPLPDPGQR